MSVTGNTGLGNANPFRYRGDYYDSETGLYYLYSRYYDPEIGRFINADSIAGIVGDIGSHNIFAYCQNNPVNRYDPNGDTEIVIGGAVVIGGIVAGIGMLIYGMSKQQTANKIKEKVKSVPDQRKNVRDQSVYVLMDSNGNIKYVGRTNNPDRRER